MVIVFNLSYYLYICRLAVQGIDASGEVHAMGLRVRPCLEDEFICMHPKKTIDELVCLDEEAVFVVGGKVEGLVEGAECGTLHIDAIGAF